MHTHGILSQSERKTDTCMASYTLYLRGCNITSRSRGVYLFANVITGSKILIAVRSSTPPNSVGPYPPIYLSTV